MMVLPYGSTRGPSHSRQAGSATAAAVAADQVLQHDHRGAEGGGRGGRANFRLPRLEKQIEKPGSWAAPLACLAPGRVSGSPRESKAPRRVAIEKMYGASGGKGLLRATTTGLTPFATRGGGRREASSV